MEKLWGCCGGAGGAADRSGVRSGRRGPRSGWAWRAACGAWAGRSVGATTRDGAEPALAFEPCSGLWGQDWVEE